MADFVEVMGIKSRMCKYYDDCSDGCPLENTNFCNLSEHSLSEKDLREAEVVMLDWNKKHPVIYPTWGEYFGMIYGARLFGNPIGSLDEIFKINIPQDIAEKLGVEPKEE